MLPFLPALTVGDTKEGLLAGSAQPVFWYLVRPCSISDIFIHFE